MVKTKNVGERFLLQHGQVQGNACFWAAAGGYTCDLSKAERFTEAQADKIIADSRGSHDFIKWRVAQVYTACVNTVSIEALQRL